MPDLYYHPMSFPSLAPIFTAEAAGIDYNTKLVDLTTGEQSSPEYLAVNPFGKVPALKEGDFTLAESAAIMRYMARKEGSALYPNEPQAQAKVDQWMDYVNHHIRTNVGKVHFNRTLAAMIGAEVDEKSLADGERFLSANFPAIESCLSQQPFLCGGAMTLADIALVAALEPSDMSKIDMSDYPSLTKWLTARRSETFYTNVHSHYGAELGM
ncbi:MAG: glutathione S-transferase family protein [Hellea sp.]